MQVLNQRMDQKKCELFFNKQYIRTEQHVTMRIHVSTSVNLADGPGCAALANKHGLCSTALLQDDAGCAAPH